jgi:O-antigen/teichoic acid export membrane protein
MTRRLLGAGASTLAMHLVGVGLLLVTTIILTRAMGVDQYGVYVVVLGLAGVLGEPQFVALRTLAVRHGAVYMGDGATDAFAGLLRRLRLFSLAGAALVALVLGLAAPVVGGSWGPEALAVCLVAAGLPFLQGYSRVSDGALRADGSVVAGQLPKLVLRPALLLGYVIAAALMMGAAFSASWAMAMQLAAAATAAAIYCLLIRRRLGGRLSAVQPVDHWPVWRGELAPLLTSSILQIVDTRVALLMLGVLAAAADAGRFHVVLRLAELIALTQAVANLVIEPMIARWMAAGETARAQRTITMAARLVFALTLAASLAVIAIGPWLLGWFGPGFSEAAPALAVLAGAQTVKAGLGTVAPLLNITGHARETWRGTAIGVAIQIGLSLLLIPAFGLLGAAWAVLVSTTITKLYLMRRVYRRLGLYTTALGPWIDPRHWRGGAA